MPKSMEAYVYSLLYNTPGYDYDRVNVLILNLLYYHRALQTWAKYWPKERILLLYFCGTFCCIGHEWCWAI